jgi:hypothetical protein
MSGAIENADPAKQQAAEALIEASESLRALIVWWVDVTKELYTRHNAIQRLIYRSQALSHGLGPEPPAEWAQAFVVRAEQMRCLQ